MKKCPECGNPSYDGALACGNCGYKFPLPKAKTPKKETNIFKKDEKKTETKKVEKKPILGDKKKENKQPQEESTIQIIKDNKIIIGAIILVTILVICGIVLLGNNTQDKNTTITTDLVKVSEAGFSFSIPSSWKEISGNDTAHPTAKYYDAGNDTTVEFYNITSSYKSLKEINSDRLTQAQQNKDYVNTVETLTIDERNASNIILENSNGDYTRYVSIFSDGKLYVFKITGSSLNNVNSTAINDAISTSHIG